MIVTYEYWEDAYGWDDSPKYMGDAIDWAQNVDFDPFYGDVVSYYVPCVHDDGY